MATITSYGGAEVVTGSCHLLTLSNETRILIDCGMFQGGEEELNENKFGFTPSSIDYLLITHAHLDHIGRIPKLVKEGFRGFIYATSATRDLAEIILLDSAKIMQEDYETAYKKAQRQGKEDEIKTPLYEEADVAQTFELEWKYPKYNESFELEEGVKVTFHDAGHILGASFIEITYNENSLERTIVFSGDIGNDNHLVMNNLQKCSYVNYLYVESTYGDRDHKNIEESIVEFKSVIIETLEKNGNVLIPSFAVERTQELLCILKEMHDRKELPMCKIFVDSPMAIEATQVYDSYCELLSEKCQEYKKRDGTIFGFENLFFTADVESSKAINNEQSRAIIIAGSGMCTGGRIVHHFKNRLWNPLNAVIFVGYQSVGTLGRRIVDGARWMKLYNEDILIKASIHTINGFSAHADQNALLRWIMQMEELYTIYLIHGERDKQVILRSVIENALEKKVHIVKPEETIYIG